MDRLDPTSVTSRLAALALLLGALFLFWLLIVAPITRSVMAFPQKTEEMRETAFQLSAFTSRQQANSPSSLETSDGNSFRAEIEGNITADRAAALLQSRLRDRLSSLGHDLTSYEFVGSERVGSYERLDLALSFNSTMSALVRFLETAESEEFGARIQEISIQPLRQQRNGNDVSTTILLSVYRLASAGTGVSDEA